MRGLQILLGVSAGACLIAAIGLVIIGDVQGAVSPAMAAVLGGVVLYRQARNPPELKPWSRVRIVVSAVVGGAGTLAVLGMLGWVALFVPDWPARAVAVGGMVLVVALGTWMVRTVRKLNQQAAGPAD
ncbi:hypothetical protein [Kribbella sp. NPDC004875]|uniref:hypothetical protein n=1 Tax=Kribbella sp. NPDC004875 TaxID=3364107 RepID=UPI0036821534